MTRFKSNLLKHIRVHTGETWLEKKKIKLFVLHQNPLLRDHKNRNFIAKRKCCLSAVEVF